MPSKTTYKCETSKLGHVKTILTGENDRKLPATHALGVQCDINGQWVSLKMSFILEAEIEKEIYA